MTYKSDLRERLVQLFNDFFNEERGNRVTTNNMEGFTLKVMSLLSEMEEGRDDGEADGVKL